MVDWLPGWLANWYLATVYQLRAQRSSKVQLLCGTLGALQYIGFVDWLTSLIINFFTPKSFPPPLYREGEDPGWNPEEGRRGEDCSFKLLKTIKMQIIAKPSYHTI